MPVPAQAALLLALGAVGAPLALALLAVRLPRRPNHAGKRIPTAAGVIFLPIILLALVLAILAVELSRAGIPYLVYAFVAGMVGFLDDVWGGGEARGFRGHLGALARGRSTTGVLKLGVLGGGAVVFGAVVADGAFGALLVAAVMAGSANLANLLDVRPGRAIKFVGLALGLALAVAPSWGAVLAALPVVGGAAVLFPSDVRGRIMLGDAGAAVLGATLGYAVVVGGPGPAAWFALAVILGLTVLAEFSSISKAIERVGFLRRFDSWGRDRG